MRCTHSVMINIVLVVGNLISTGRGEQWDYIQIVLS